MSYLSLIVALPGPWRDGLRAMLMEIPRIKSIHLADDASAALSAVAVDRPALVVLDAGLLGDAAWALTERLRARWPQTLCLVLVDDNQQRRKARASGADAVLVKGCPAAALFETIESLLADRL
jgi:DNA-binding NarL/FixJ family response regulator